MSIQDDLNKASELTNSGACQEAIEIYTRLAESDKDNWKLFGDRASARFQARDWRGALSDLNRAIELANHDPSANQSDFDDLKAIRTDANAKQQRQHRSRIHHAPCPKCSTKLVITLALTKTPIRCPDCNAIVIYTNEQLQITTVEVSRLRRFFRLGPIVEEKALTLPQAVKYKSSHAFVTSALTTLSLKETSRSGTVMLYCTVEIQCVPWLTRLCRHNMYDKHNFANSVRP